MQQIQQCNSNITLEINITIGKDFKKTLTYFYGQDPILAASLFCEQNNLKPSAVYYIQQAIEQVINNVNDVEDQNDQYHIQEDNLNEESDQNPSQDFKYQRERAAPLRQNEYNQKQIQRNQFNQNTKMSNQQCNLRLTQNFILWYQNGKRAECNNMNNVYNPGIRLYQRGQAYNQRKEKKILQMKERLEQEDLKEATFSPSLNFNSLLISEKQDQSEWIERMKKKKEEKINEIKQNSLLKEQEKCTFKPQIGVVSSRISQYTKEHREVQDVFSYLHQDSYRRKEDINKKQQEKIEKQIFQLNLTQPQIQLHLFTSMEEKYKLECTFTPEICSFNKSFDVTHNSNKKYLDMSPEKVDDLYKSLNSSLNSSQVSTMSEGEGLIVNHPKIKTPMCNYPKEYNEQNQIQNQNKKKCFFNLENKFQQMKLQRLASPKKIQTPEEKPAEIQKNRSNSMKIWDNLYEQAIQQKENQKECEHKIKKEVQKEINKQKLSMKSKEIINQQRNQIIECIFEVLDGKKLGQIGPDNLHSEYLSDNLNKILKPLYDAIIMNNTILESDQFKKAVKTLYNTIHFSDKLAISRILQKKSFSLLTDKKDNSHEKIKNSHHSCKEADYVCKRCKTCSDTLNILDQMDEIKSNYTSTNKYNDQQVHS